MEETNKVINQHIWRQRIGNAKYVVAILVFLSIPGGFTIYNLLSPVIEKSILVGVVESVYQGHSVTGTDVDQFYVRLEDGNLVNVPIDRNIGIPFRKFAGVKIEKTVKESGKVYYEFKGYIQ